MLETFGQVSLEAHLASKSFSLCLGLSISHGPAGAHVTVGSAHVFMSCFIAGFSITFTAVISGISTCA